MRFLSPRGGNGMSKASPPALASVSSLSFSQPWYVGAHVHGQRLGEGAEAARLLAAV